MPQNNTAISFIEELKSFYAEKELGKLEKFFKGDDSQTKALGVKFGNVFNTAKQYVDLPLDEIEKLLESEFYEVRMGAVSIMDFQVQQKGTTEEQRKKLFELYLNRHDRINNWDLVDRAAKRVVGSYLHDFEKNHDILYRLARSENVWERRTAIVATTYFIAKKDLDDTFKIAEILIPDTHDLIRKATGSCLRECGKKDETRLRQFLDKHAAKMAAITISYATEKLDKQLKDHYKKQRTLNNS
jgi:3-methyladenine DNA glycosylase AlkD